jgi:hypothetical protein
MPTAALALSLQMANRRSCSVPTTGNMLNIQTPPIGRHLQSRLQQDLSKKTKSVRPKLLKL